jgi:hypothetical protein
LLECLKRLLFAAHYFAIAKPWQRSLAVYDNVGLVKAFFTALGRKKCVGKRRRGESGVKGAYFAFISTLDTGLPTSTIGFGSNLWFHLRFDPLLEKTVLPCQTTQARTLHSITLDGNRVGSTNHVFGPVKLHDYLFKLSRLAREAGCPIS